MSYYGDGTDAQEILDRLSGSGMSKKRLAAALSRVLADLLADEHLGYGVVEENGEAS